MRAFAIDASGAAPAHRDLPSPEAGDGELLVRVRASSVNPVDNAIAAGMLEGMFEHEYPVILGRDFAGVIERTGPGTSRFSAGDAVFSFIRHAAPVVNAGSWAERVVVPESAVAAVPEGVGMEVAGAAPLAGITALTAVDALGLAAGQTVLVVGASGGVGTFAVQLAAAGGAHVIATGRADDHELLRGLGAAEVVDRDGDVGAAVLAGHPEGIDAVIDLVSYGADQFAAYGAALKDDGQAASPLSAFSGDEPGRHAIMAAPEPTLLDRLGAALAAGTVRVPIQARYRFDAAGEALAALPATHTQGKLALSVD